MLPMRLLLAVLAFTLPVVAQGMPAASRVDAWKSKHNQVRLKLDWNTLPDNSPVRLPDGTTEPRRAPWPFLLYVIDQAGSKSNKKLQDKVFADARFVLAGHAVKVVKLKPRKVVDIPYVSGVRGIRDPALIFVDRDFKVVGALKTHKDFTEKKVTPS